MTAAHRILESKSDYSPESDPILINYKKYWSIPFQTMLDKYLNGGGEVEFSRLCERERYMNPEETEIYNSHITKLATKYESVSLNDLSNQFTEQELILLGDAYYTGTGIPCSYQKAANCFLAAKSPFSIYKYALLFYFGKDHAWPQDIDKARKYFEEAKAQGICTAAFRLGEMHMTGNGFPTDETKALTEFLFAAEGNISYSFESLSVCYQRMKKPEESMQYLGKATEFSPLMLAKLGELYLFGNDDENNPMRGFYYCEEALKRKSKCAFVNLMIFHFRNFKEVQQLSQILELAKGYFECKDKLTEDSEREASKTFAELVHVLCVSASKLPDRILGSSILLNAATLYDPRGKTIAPIALHKNIYPPQLAQNIQAMHEYFRKYVKEHTQECVSFILKSPDPKATLQAFMMWGLCAWDILNNLQLQDSILGRNGESKSNEFRTQTLVRQIFPDLPELGLLSTNKSVSLDQLKNELVNIIICDDESEAVKAIQQKAIQWLKKFNALDEPLPFVYISKLIDRWFQTEKIITQSDNRPALSLAASRGRINVMRELIKAGADASLQRGIDPVLIPFDQVKNFNEEIPVRKPRWYLPGYSLSMAVSALQVEAVKELLREKPGNLDLALYVLSNTFDKDVVKFFNPRLPVERYSEARIEIARLLIAASANVNSILFLSLERDKTSHGFFHLLCHGISGADAKFVAFLLSQIKFPDIVKRTTSVLSYDENNDSVIGSLAQNGNFVEVAKIVVMLVQYLENMKLAGEKLVELLNQMLSDLVYNNPKAAPLLPTIGYLIDKGADLRCGIFDIRWTNIEVLEMLLKRGMSLHEHCEMAYFGLEKMTADEHDEKRQANSFKVLQHFDHYFYAALSYIVNTVFPALNMSKTLAQEGVNLCQELKSPRAERKDHNTYKKLQAFIDKMNAAQDELAAKGLNDQFKKLLGIAKYPRFSIYDFFDLAERCSKEAIGLGHRIDTSTAASTYVVATVPQPSRLTSHSIFSINGRHRAHEQLLRSKHVRCFR